MTITVTVRVSGNVEEPDFDELRDWLERTYSGEWKRTSSPEAADTLGTSDVLVGVLEHFAGALGEEVGAVLAKEGIDVAKKLPGEIAERFRRIREKYPDGEQPQVDVEVHHDDETPSR